MRRAPNAALLTGLLLAAMGFAIAVVAAQVPQGTLRVMGPGVLPRQLGLGLGALGVGISAVGAVFLAAPVLRSSAALVLAVGAGVLLFGALVAEGGLLLAACMALLFTGLLRQPMPAWPRWV